MTSQDLLDYINKTITIDNTFAICFVCLGNICRSPTAEGIFQHIVNEKSLADYFEIDSAGTAAYHIGETANSRSQKVANEHGIQLTSRGRQFLDSDLAYFDLILAMDYENLANIKNLDSYQSNQRKVHLLRTFDPVKPDTQVPDPYFGGMDGFKKVFDVIYRSCNHLLDKLEPKIIN